MDASIELAGEVRNDDLAGDSVGGLNERVDALSGKAGPSPAAAEAPGSGSSLPPPAVAGIAALAAMLAAALGAAIALRWSGRAGGGLATADPHR